MPLHPPYQLAPLTGSSGLALPRLHRGASTQVVTLLGVVVDRSVVIVAIVPTVAATAGTVGSALPAVAAFPLVGTVEVRLARTIAASATMIAATVTGLGVLSTVTAK